MSVTPVYIICSPRPLVGKTLIARLLSEFLLLKNGTVISFDINLKEPSLLEYLPRTTETADVIDTFGKMQLMDRLIVNDSVAKVIDLGFHAFDEFFRMTDEIGFMKEAVRRGVAPVILFVADTDREHLLVHFEMTAQMVAEQVRGLSPAQLEYKASPDRWSIREVVSHLAVAEPDYWREIQKALKAAPDMKDKKSQATDADVMWYGIDRVVHTKTGGGHEKVDTYKDLGEALGKFQALRATMIDYIKTTQDDLRAHSFGDYGEVIDCWQWMLEISTHSERHINQIREIKNDPNFPKK